MVTASNTPKAVKILWAALLISLAAVGITSCFHDSNEAVTEFPPPPLLSPIYFHYKSDKIEAHYWREIQILARYIRKYPQMQVIVEGHTDSDGDEKKNLELGEQRATAVKRLLMHFGTPVQQIYTVSKGEYCPAMIGVSTLAAQLNRRVEFILRTGTIQYTDPRITQQQSIELAGYSRNRCW